MQNLIFEKYSASGNDFLITHMGFEEEKKYDFLSFPDIARFLCHRFEGIGADGMVLVFPHLAYPYCWDFYNSDGSKASMCGNASRCVGLYAFLHTIASQKHQFLSGAGEIEIEILSSDYPYRVKSKLGQYKALGEFGEWSLFDTGVPHLIKLGTKEEFEKISPKEMKNLREHYNANVNIAYQENDCYRIKTYERGVEGITLACGTGMASLVALLKERYTYNSNQKIEIIPPIGERLVFGIEENRIVFGGEVKKIAQCIVNLKDFGVRI